LILRRLPHFDLTTRVVVTLDDDKEVLPEIFILDGPTTCGLPLARRRRPRFEPAGVPETFYDVIFAGPDDDSIEPSFGQEIPVLVQRLNDGHERRALVRVGARSRVAGGDGRTRGKDEARVVDELRAARSPAV
jgi:hypothetical protein